MSRVAWARFFLLQSRARCSGSPQYRHREFSIRCRRSSAVRGPLGPARGREIIAERSITVLESLLEVWTAGELPVKVVAVVAVTRVDVDAGLTRR